MKSKIGIIALIAVIGLSIAGCASDNSIKQPISGVTYNIAIPAKNIQVLGIVRVETKVDDEGNGELITYDALLKEAEKKGGNGIANIMIDMMQKDSSETTWYGSALAIKFTDDNLPANTPLSPITTRITGGIGVDNYGVSSGSSIGIGIQAAPTTTSRGIRQ
jgi:hypothetical protein